MDSFSNKSDSVPIYRVFVDQKLSDRSIREVKPYIQEFSTFAKGRWLGRELIEVLSTEFGAHPLEYWKNAIGYGFIRINDKKTHENYRFQNSDKLGHRAHRHEPMVFGQIDLVGETDELLAVNKPASIPMHSCGAYNYNSLERILQLEPILPHQTTLHLVHRLDRLTSGLVVLAKSKSVAAKVSKEIRMKTTDKIYLARVRGRFPQRIVDLRQYDKIDLSLYSEDSDTTDEPEKLTGKRKSPPSSESLKEDLSNPNLPQLNESSFEKLCAAPNVGYFRCQANKSPDWRQSLFSNFIVSDEEYWIQCPLAVVSFRDGIHACRVDGKPSLSRFRSLGYCAKTDTSLIECKPYTGRTHQLRLHLQLIGNPIANDPCYGGELFYSNDTRKAAAIDAMTILNSFPDYKPLSNIPHFVEDSTEEVKILVNRTRKDFRKSEVIEKLPNETEDEFLVRSCRNCRGNTDLVRLEHLLHCDGIWLHALRYSGRDWEFATKLPDWAQDFAIAKTSEKAAETSSATQEDVAPTNTEVQNVDKTCAVQL